MPVRAGSQGPAAVPKCTAGDAAAGSEDGGLGAAGVALVASAIVSFPEPRAAQPQGHQEM